MTSRLRDSIAADLPGFLFEVGEIVVYTPAGGTARDVTAITGTRAAPSDFPTLRADGLAVWVRFIASDVPELAQGDAVSFADNDYTVDGIEPDRAGTVMVTLINDA